MKPLVAVVGPTATGKSDLAIRLALEFGGEVISADSRQIYRHMDIGTAKITREEQAMVPHHCIDIRNPDEDFSVARYQETAREIIDNLHEKAKLPVIAGGTGQYVWALLEGWGIPRVKPDAELRRSLEERAANGEATELYRELQQADPEAAANIDPRNVRRVIRALEVVRLTDRPFSSQRIKKEPPYDALIIGLTAERQKLYERIDLRVDRMIEQGFVKEVQRLLDMKYGPELPAMSSIGYKQILMYLEGEISLESAVSQIKTGTHRLVRRQYNWFRLTDERIHWLDIAGDYGEQSMELVKRFLAERK